MIDIVSSSNQHIKHIKSLLTKKGRCEYGQYTVEGIKSVNEAISSGCDVLKIFVSDEFSEDKLLATNAVIYRVNSSIFEKICDTKTPQGVIAVVSKKNPELMSLKENGMYLYCDSIQDPGNMGTLIRTADAAGFDGVLLSPGCVEIYNPKTVRASMGSFFKMDIFENIADISSYGAKIYGGALLDNTKDYRNVDYSGTVIIVVGNEANGICDEILKLCTPVKIPIYGGAESLNAAVAAGILMYEVSNKKHAKG